MEKIIIKFPEVLPYNIWFLIIIGHENPISKGRDHKQLLQHGVHIADAPQIPDSTVPVRRSKINH